VSVIRYDEYWCVQEECSHAKIGRVKVKRRRGRG
jgi:hypothetical protein